MDEQPQQLAESGGTIGNPDINFFGLTNFRNQNRRFGIKLDDRRRHMYVVGKTGMGKTTILENMVLNDIYAGHGVGLVDPHGDFAEKILDYIPPKRINDVVYFNPADIDFPIGFNILETVRADQKHLIASGLMGVFKKIWPDVWSARMEYILNNTILALLDFPGTTLLGINRMLADEEYRRRVVNNSKDPVVKAFWLNEFANYQDKFRTEAVAPIQNKIGQFLSASVIRNIVAQVKSRIDIREIMDTRKIFIMNLSKGRIGEDNSRLLGGMLITKIQLAAMERVDMPEKDRKDFFLYVDEFQNFATESFANILSEARKYRLDLIMAHQYMEQLDEKVLAAVIGNVGTMTVFRVGSSDAEILAKEFTPTFVEEDLVNLPKYHIYLKLMIDGVASRPFSALTLPPIGSPTGSTERVVRVSRERYAVPRDKIEDKIARWSGMVVADAEDASMMEIDEDEARFKSTPVNLPANADDLDLDPTLDGTDTAEAITIAKSVAPTVAPMPATQPPRVQPMQQPRRDNPPSRGDRPVGYNQSNSRPQQNQPRMDNADRGSSRGDSGGRPQGQPNENRGDRDRDRDRKRKRKRGGGGSGGGGGGQGNRNPQGAQHVVIGNPNEKGISLAQLPRTNDEPRIELQPTPQPMPEPVKPVMPVAPPKPVVPAEPLPSSPTLRPEPPQPTSTPSPSQPKPLPPNTPIMID